MPITSSAKKALRVSRRKRIFNVARLDAMRNNIKKFTSLIASKQKEEAQKLIPDLYKVIDKAAKTGVIKPNNAARKKSRLMKLLKKAN